MARATGRSSSGRRMAHVLTDEAFALSIAHFRRLGRTDVRGYWIAAIVVDVHPVEPRDAGRRDARRPIADPARFGHRRRSSRPRWPGSRVGLITGRRELVAAVVGAVVGVAVALVVEPARRDRRRRRARAARRAARAAGRGARDGAARDAGLGRALRDAGGRRPSSRTDAGRPAPPEDDP